MDGNNKDKKSMNVETKKLKKEIEKAIKPKSASLKRYIKSINLQKGWQEKKRRHELSENKKGK